MLSLSYTLTILRSSGLTLFRSSGLPVLLSSGLFCCLQLYAFNPETVLRGTVYDSNSRLPIPYASVFFEKSSIGTITDNKGRFELKYSQEFSLLTVSCIGYETQTFSIETGKKTKLEIYLKNIDYQLTEVVIKPKKEKYSKKNNPAVELIEKVIENKDKNRLESNNSWQLRQYEKFTLSLSNIENAFETKGLFKAFKFLPDYLCNSELDTFSVITLSVNEILSDEYHRKNPEKTQKIILTYRKEGIDNLIGIESLDAVYAEIFKDINIFDNDLEILMKHFVSPLSSSLATSFYNFYISDTVVYKNNRCIILDFVPKNSQDFGFSGSLWVLPDNLWAIKNLC